MWTVVAWTVERVPSRAERDPGERLLWVRATMANRMVHGRVGWIQGGATTLIRGWRAASLPRNQPTRR